MSIKQLVCEECGGKRFEQKPGETHTYCIDCGTVVIRKRDGFLLNPALSCEPPTAEQQAAAFMGRPVVFKDMASSPGVPVFGPSSPLTSAAVWLDIMDAVEQAHGLPSHLIGDPTDPQPHIIEGKPHE